MAHHGPVFSVWEHDFWWLTMALVTEGELKNRLMCDDVSRAQAIFQLAATEGVGGSGMRWEQVAGSSRLIPNRSRQTKKWSVIDVRCHHLKPFFQLAPRDEIIISLQTRPVTNAPTRSPTKPSVAAS
jgi:hypothetical protein